MTWPSWRPGHRDDLVAVTTWSPWRPGRRDDLVTVTTSPSWRPWPRYSCIQRPRDNTHHHTRKQRHLQIYIKSNQYLIKLKKMALSKKQMDSLRSLACGLMCTKKQMADRDVYETTGTGGQDLPTSPRPQPQCPQPQVQHLEDETPLSLGDIGVELADKVIMARNYRSIFIIAIGYWEPPPPPHPSLEVGTATCIFEMVDFEAYFLLVSSQMASNVRLYWS